MRCEYVQSMRWARTTRVPLAAILVHLGDQLGRQRVGLEQEGVADALLILLRVLVIPLAPLVPLSPLGHITESLCKLPPAP